MSTAAFQDIKVPLLGFGAMSLSGAYGDAHDDESLQVLKKALELGSTFWDTASIYGLGHNESLIGRFLKDNPGVRENLFIASKCGFDFDPVTKERGGLTNSSKHIHSFIDDTIQRLGTAPDLYYIHRRDPKTPLRESIGALAELKSAGKCKYIGISEPGADTLREACKIAHIDAIQIEYSAFCLDAERNGLLDTARELGVTVVAFSPLGAGILTGKFTDSSHFTGSRSEAGRFQGEALQKNLQLVKKFQAIAEEKGCTPAQLALAWVASQGIIPIPGTKNVERLIENWGASKVSISDEELAEIRKVIDGGTEGARWGPGVMSMMGK